MQTSTPAAVAAFAAGDAKVAHRLLIAWPGGLHTDMSKTIVSADIEADLVTDMPDDTRDPVGYQSRSLKLVLAGQLGDGVDETDNVFSLLSPLNAASPFARMDLRGTTLTYDRGIYVPGSATPEYFRRFTGSIDDIEPGTDDTFTITCVDRMTMLRPVVSMPAVVTGAPYNATLTSMFGHDALLRAATNGAISTWPAPRLQRILSVGMRSSPWPEVGEMDSSQQQVVPMFAQGAWGAAYAGSQTSTTDPVSVPLWSAPTYLFDESKWPLTNALAFEVTVTGVGAVPGGIDASFRYGQQLALFRPAGTRQLYKVTGLTVDVGNTGINVSTTAGSDFWTLALDATPHTILFWASISGGTLTAHAKVDGGATHTFAGITWTDDTSLWTYAQIFTAVGATTEAWQTSTETAPVTSYPFTPQAVLVPSTNAMVVTPAVTGSPLDTVRDINAADRSTSGFDEFGVYRSTTRDSRRGGVAVGTYTSDSDLSTVSMQLTSSGYANRVQVPVTSWTFGTPTTVWSADTVHKIPGRSVGYTFLVDTGDQLVAHVDGSISLRPNGGGTAGLSYFLASTDRNGVAPHGGVKAGKVIQIDATHFLVSFDNPWIRDAYLVAPYTSDLAVGTPCVQIGGVPVTAADSILTDSQWPPVAEGGAKSSARGEQPYTFADNAWRQDFGAAQALGDDTLCEMRRPVWVFTNVAIKPDWRLQLGDRIHLTAPKLFLDDDVVIFGIQESEADGSDTQTLNVRMVAPPGVWVLGLAGRDELGVNIYV